MDLFPLILLATIVIIWNSLLTYLFLSMRSSIQKITQDGKGENIIDVVGEVLANEKRIGRGLIEINKKVEDLLFDSQFYIQKIGLVRFNPFNDTGGDQSFILALVDEKNSGVVISGLHTRNGTRWYAKQVEKGMGVGHQLSNDEIKAIKAATKRVNK